VANSLNKITLIGRLGQDAELRETTAGKTYMSFSIATDKYDSQARETVPVWHNCSMFNFGDRNRTDALHPYLTKGKQICVEGTLDYWEDKDGKKRPSITVSNVVLLGSRNDNAMSETNIGDTQAIKDEKKEQDDGVPW
tara:strand:- start:1456 stop:1869 length:414 start_codon:yes stop_codon:yes gene_type:complete